MNASTVLTNGRIYTQDPDQPFVTAVALNKNVILAIGQDEEMKDLLAPGGEWIDLQGQCVVPGLVDAHVHFQGYALSLQRVGLQDMPGLDQALDRVAEYASNEPTDEWLEGRGWNQSDWPGSHFPTAADLDRVAAQQPVLLRHRSGHAAWVNSRALRQAGINADTADPPGGQIQRDSAGQPTGILFEEAMEIVSTKVPRPNEEQLLRAMRSAQQKCSQAGLTGIHDFDGRFCFQALQRLHGERQLDLRVVKNIPASRLEHAVGVGLRSGFGDNWLWIGGIKIFADGALGPRTAAMIAPYEGEPDNRGIVVTDKEEMFALANEACGAGLSVTVHAIGDRANHDILDVYEAIRGQQKEGTGTLRHRIEHVQLLHPDDFQRLVELEVIASMQPIHATSDMEMAERYWGDRNKYSYAWRTVLDGGATLVFGSDAPVESIDPLTGIHAAVTRRRQDGMPGEEGWRPEQRLTVSEAVLAYTMGAAITSGRERIMGSISPGKLADLTIFNRDIYQIPGDELLDVGVAATMVDGRFSYRK